MFVYMENKVDMYYRFVWDTEPTDEQLQTLMEEVGEEVRIVRERVDERLREQVRNEYLKVKQRKTVSDGKA